MQDFATGKAAATGRVVSKLTCSYLKKIVSPQVGLIMRLTGILLLAACLHVSAKGLTQTVSLSEKDAPLIKVMKKIEQQTGYAFFYKSQWLVQAKKVTIKAENIPLQQALDLCFKDQPFTYVVSGKNISIEPKDEKPVKKPTIDVSGKITDKEGNPLVGANIKLKGTNKGTTTNADGSFTLKDVDENSVLEISYVGFETQIISLEGRNSIAVNLNPKNSALDETIIIAYGTTTKRFSTGNISQVKAADIEKQPVNNPLFALQGRIPGVTVTQTSGLPGAGVIVRIQGQNSLQNGNGPLYVVDGVPVPTEVPTPIDADVSNLPNSGESFVRQGNNGRGNTLNFLNPSDIESIEILKDADATAIYGSRAANGAILITTKKGKAGKPTLNTDVQQGFGEVGHFMKLLYTPQYLEMRREALKNDGLTATLTDPFDPGYAPDLLFWDTTSHTNWQKELIGGRAQYTHANASISGGSSEVQYLIGGSYHKETTVFPGSFSDQRGSMHLNLNNNNDLKNKFHFQISSSFSADKNKLPKYDLTPIALQLVPNAPALYSNDGSLNWALNSNGSSTFVNPLAPLFYQTYIVKTNNLIANGNFSYEVLPGLRASASLGFTNLQSSDLQTNSILAERPENRSLPWIVRQAFFGDSKLNTWSIEPQLSYKKSLGKGKFDGLAGTSFQRTFKEAGYLYGTGFNNDQSMTSPNAAATLTSAAFLRSLYKYNAIFSRLNYTYNDKYVLNLTGRRDGSTRFGSNDKFHNFWSAGAAWIFSQESFFVDHNSFFSFGKLKGSYGTTGSDQIGDYRFLTLYNVVNPQISYQGITGLTPSDIPNRYLQWEETKKLSLGLDLGFLNRIFITGNYSRNRSSNELLDYALPAITGRNSVLLNFDATVENSNWEFTLSTENVKTKHFSWTTNFNLTISRNKLVDFPNLKNSSYKYNYIVGEPISLTKLLHFGQVDPASGLYTMVDSSGKSTSTPAFPADYTNLFINFPKFYGGFQNTIQYKGFQLDILLQFVKKMAPSPGFGIQVPPGIFSEFNSTGNQPVSALNRWQKPGDNVTIQKFIASYGPGFDAFFNATYSDKYYTDASFIRLKNLSLSWELPSSWVHKIHLQSSRLFAQAQNLLTITKYKGLDPETPGYTTLPPLRVVTFGLQVKL